MGEHPIENLMNTAMNSIKDMIDVNTIIGEPIQASNNTVIIPISKVGFEYKDAIFVPSQENGSTVYSGRLRGQKAYFSVSQDKTVVFHYGNKIYGPYTVKEDNTAIPEEEKTLEGIVGVELRQGRLTGKLQEDIPPGLL